jgi:anti-sigma-K factor RskA
MTRMMHTLRSVWAAAKGWRTVLLSIALAVVGVLQTADWTMIVGPKQVGPVMLAIGILVAVLRVVTDTPVGRMSTDRREDD